jgi:large subunit ribosomal protein L6
MQIKSQKIPTKTEIFISSFGNKNLLIVKKNSPGTKFKYYNLPSDLILTKNENHLLFSSKTTSKESSLALEKSFLAVARYFKSLEKPSKKKLVLKGLGFKATLSPDSKTLELKLGLSHTIILDIPLEDLNVKIDKNNITIEGFDPVKVGNFATQVRNFRYPDSYKGKGFWYKNEIKVLKEVKKT